MEPDGGGPLGARIKDIVFPFLSDSPLVRPEGSRSILFFRILFFLAHLDHLPRHSSGQQLTSAVSSLVSYRLNMAPLAQAVTVSLKDLQNGMRSQHVHLLVTAYSV